MVVKRAFHGHGVDAVIFREESEFLCQPELKAILFPKRNAKEMFKIPFIQLHAVKGPENVIHHPLPFGKPDSQ